MLKDITIIDFQGKEKRAQANYTEVNTNKINHSSRVQRPKVEYILLKGEFIYPTSNLVFYSSDGNSYYIE
ncbi:MULTISPECIES: hypothetical protein [Acinetobacter]|jgi:hypothetical protein|uniref:hypothetical protein n=1 Tax=Acinetobacter TaxID=469 RepID=UPI0002CE7402|nr:MULTISPECIES: hypothetical protein [Acinetobacter]ENU09339.1 hypothetical protein F997_02788 [Acinetobacter calcoaceticus NIPH 13]MBJ9723371.1 hypothetical protein [Acinetobacter calcoaceticus]MBP2603412.1 hypothetical protein [Acinetobacter calcoaceticus]WNY30231.1 hypothetical protein Q4S33_14025 [Acinetobacter calcoaceticus]CAI3143398.1 hypothetical protein MWMV18_MWMV18_01388 [Acinetobacter calcoaceticus]